MLRTPGARRQLGDGILYRLWPLLSRAAALHRRTIVRGTRVVAVTGTFGKSTTARAIADAILAPSGPKTFQNAFSSVARAVLRIRPGQRHAVIEAGISGRGHMAAYAPIVRPDVAVVTSIGTEHWRELPTPEDKREEKVALVRALPPGGVAILNGDDAHVMWMAGEAPGRVLTFGTVDGCDVRASEIAYDWPHGMRFRLDAFGATREVAIRLVGPKMVSPILAAIAVAHVEGFALDDALARLAAFEPTPGRLQPVTLPNGAILLRDDYKNTLETNHVALDVLEAIPARRKLVLFGDLSDVQGREWRVYLSLGMRVARIAERFLVVGRGYRRYASGACRGGMARDRVVDVGRTVQEAAEALKRVLEPGDVVLMKARRGQKLDRVRLILEGRKVGCSIKLCEIRTMECAYCPMLERGWGDHPVFAPGWIEPRADRKARLAKRVRGR